MTATPIRVAIDSSGLHATAQVLDGPQPSVDLRGADENALMTAVFEHATAQARATGATVTLEIADERAEGSDLAPLRLEVDPDQNMRPAAQQADRNEPPITGSAAAGRPVSRPSSVVRVTGDVPPPDPEPPPHETPHRRFDSEGSDRRAATRQARPTSDHYSLHHDTIGTAPQASASGLRGVVPTGPARRGMRGRLNAALGLKLAASVDEQGVRAAESTISGPVPDRAVVSVINVKGGVGKTPLSLALASQMATHRGPGTVAAVDLGESNNSFADRIVNGGHPEFDTVGLLDLYENTGGAITSAMLSRYLTRQPSGEDVLIGRDDVGFDLGFDDADALATLLSQFRDLLIVDTGNGENAGRWQWAVVTAQVVLIPVPLRADVVAVARRMIGRIAARRPLGLAGVMVIITDGPGDTPDIEADQIEQLTRGDGIEIVLRMPYEPVFASGQPITSDSLALPTRDALTRLGSHVITALTGTTRTT
ncbi:MAG: ParA family protein [Rhodococcus sp.]|jgi:cellulose biosynthesis protein BcsQ|nr:ParA family protein [Rhodococcus sp. (in: high G+C Gram-positive bacteria)]MBJ7323774.1 ParA family protein [Rhodococcus sp. (in: high G+C Gram-positive bacteria)]